MSQLLRIVLIVLVFGAALFVWVEIRQGEDAEEVGGGEEVVETTYGSEKGVELIVTSPTKDSIVTSPLTITGEAPGFWYPRTTMRSSSSSVSLNKISSFVGH